jgi:shikimate kinase
MRIFLTGYMGSGKSTLGKRLANKLDITFIDLDEYFEQKFRTSITLFFERFGEDSFRILEHEVLKEVIDKQVDMIISTGGGTPCYFNNMELMNKYGVTVYLKLPPAVLASRLSNSPFRYRRPKLKGLDKNSLLETVIDHLTEREAYYNQSQIIIDAFKMKIEDVFAIITGSPYPETDSSKTTFSI